MTTPYSEKVPYLLPFRARRVAVLASHIEARRGRRAHPHRRERQTVAGMTWDPSSLTEPTFYDEQERPSLEEAWRRAEEALAAYVAKEEDPDDMDGFGLRLDGDAGGYNAYARDWVTDEDLASHTTQDTPVAALLLLEKRLRDMAA